VTFLNARAGDRRESVYVASVGQCRDTKLGAYAFCVRGDGAVLLARMAPDHPDAGLWTLPGGGVEFGEHPDDTVLRELREETGLVGERGQVVAVYSRTYERSPTRPRPSFQHLGLIYEVRVEGSELLVEVGGSTDLCQWVSQVDLPSQPLVELAAFAVAELIRTET
jgi:ADP-ribose pyrophosphatase YjhB (NUDIX family)